MTEFATCTIKDGIATITLDDGKANALSFAMMDALTAAWDKAEAQGDVILLTGREGVLCAGFDLKVMRGEPDRVGEMVTTGGRLLTRIFGCPKPVVIAATGHAIAAGGLLVLVGDYRIGTIGEARYGLNETAIGMVLPPYGIDMATFRLNRAALDDAVVGATLYDAEAACRVGYLDEATTPDKLAARAMEKAKAMQELRARAYAGNKKHIRGALAAKMMDELKDGANISG